MGVGNAALIQFDGGVAVQRCPDSTIGVLRLDGDELPNAPPASGMSVRWCGGTLRYANPPVVARTGTQDDAGLWS